MEANQIKINENKITGILSNKFTVKKQESARNKEKEAEK